MTTGWLPSNSIGAVRGEQYDVDELIHTFRSGMWTVQTLKKENLIIAIRRDLGGHS
jgi:hypothetical protein